MDPLFYTDPTLLEIWRVLTGCIFLNLSDEERIYNNNLHRRRSTTVQRENMLSGILDKFTNLPYYEQLETFFDSIMNEES
mgnify:CR=1 FL=1